MLRAATISVLAASLAVAGCNGAPSAVKPTLAAVEALRAACGDGQPDNVPRRAWSSGSVERPMEARPTSNALLGSQWTATTTAWRG